MEIGFLPFFQGIRGVRDGSPGWQWPTLPLHFRNFQVHGGCPEYTFRDVARVPEAETLRSWSTTPREGWIGCKYILKKETKNVTRNRKEN